MNRSAIAIDPGYSARGNGCACAASNPSGDLIDVWYARPGVHRHVPLFGALAVIVEKPQLDSRSWDKVQTILELSWQGALLAGQYAGELGAEIVERTPSAWKGSEAKPPCHARLWRSLIFAEQAILGGDATWRQIDAACERGALDGWRRGKNYYPERWAHHNILDAAALLMTHLGRMRG